MSYAAKLNYAQRTGRARAIPESEMLASYDLDTGRIKHNSLYLDAIMMGLQPPEFEQITVPALGIFALPGSPDALMEVWYDQDDPTVQQIVRELFEKEQEMKLAAIARFDSEIPNSTVLPLENADHWIFLSHEAQVLQAIDDFVSGLH